MRLLDDERGQSVQVGAAILLAFVVIAITIYQVEVVSSQNAEVEFNHNQEVREDLTELRNSISNAGTERSSESVSVKLGTQYPPRTIFVNPAPVSGMLWTETAGNISFGENTEVSGDYEGDAQALVDRNHTTSRMVYTPRYSELDDAGVTHLEHSLVFNTFENGATDPITAQQVVSGDSLTLTVLRGNVSEQGPGSVAIDPRTVSGLTDPVTISNASGGPVSLKLPTETPNVWNETIGVEFGDNDARVTGYDGSRAYLELNRSEYELQMALVGIGEGVNETDRYDVQHPSGGGGTVGSDDFAIEWVRTGSRVVKGETLHVEANVSNVGTAAGSEMVDLTIDDGEIEGKTVNLSVGEVKTVEWSVPTSDLSPGDHTLQVGAGGEPKNGTFEIESRPTSAYFAVQSVDVDKRIQEGVTLDVVATIENVGDDLGTQDVALSVGGEQVDSSEVELPSSDSTDVSLSYDSSPGDANNDVSVEIVTDDDTVERSVRIVEPAADYEVAIIDSPDEVGAGEEIEIEVRIRNDGEGTGTQNIELHRSGLDNTVAVEPSVTLNPGEERTFTISAPTNSNDEGTDVDVSAESEDDSDTRTVSVLNAPSFSVLSLSSNSPIVEGDSLQVTAEIGNAEGSGTGIQTVQLDLREHDGTIVGQDSADLTLAGGESDTVTLTYDSVIGDGSASDYEAVVSTENDDDQIAATIQNNIQFRDGSEGRVGDTGISFTVDKTVQEHIAITDIEMEGSFEVSAENTPTRVDNGEQNEIDVSVNGGDDGYANAQGGSSAIDLGTRYRFWDEGTAPQIGHGNGGSATFQIREFENDAGTVNIDGVSQGSQSDHNLAVTLYYDDNGNDRSTTIYLVLESPNT